MPVKRNTSTTQILEKPVGAPPLPVKSSTLRKNRTRRRILDAARKIFAEKGFEAANVSDIVSHIEMAQGTFYYHFPDKRSILLEMIGEFFGEVKALAASWARTTDMGAEAADRFARDIATLLYRNRDITHIIMIEMHNPDPEVRRLIRDFYEYLYQQTQLGLELGARLGVVRPLDTRVAAVALVGMMQSVVVNSMDCRKPIDLDHLIGEISNLQNYGIRPRPDAPPARHKGG